MTQFQCPLCSNKCYDSILSLSKHWSRTHKLTTDILFLKLNGMEEAPVCKCGCGEAVKFLDAGRGYSEYVWGHGARVSNNFQTEKSKSNSLITRKKMLKEGAWKPFALKETGENWAKGLTKESDERIREKAENITSERRQRMAETMRSNRLSGVVRTLRKEEHSQWKGGVSSLNHFCHANRRLYSEWKYPILLAANFRCSICSSAEKVEVHHNGETFSEILRSLAKLHNWEEKLATFFEGPVSSELSALKDKISDAIAAYHIENNVPGVVLCRDCHKALHHPDAE